MAVMVFLYRHCANLRFLSGFRRRSVARLIISNIAYIEDASSSSDAKLKRFGTTMAGLGCLRTSAKLECYTFVDLRTYPL